MITSDSLQSAAARLEQAHLLPTYGERALMIKRGEGCYVFDAEGNRYLDFITGIGVNALGYGHPAILAALRDQAALCIHTSNLHMHPHQGALAEKLAQWSGLDRVFFSNSGTEAMEAALKAAKALANRNGPRRHRIVALDNSFHGRSSGALAITGQKKYRDPFLPLASDVTFIPANDIGALQAAAQQGCIAIVTETVQGEGGIYPLNTAFLAAVRATAAEQGALWIADETQCGLGRTGARFAYQHHPTAGLPDIVVTAKPLAGGLPLGATMFTNAAAAGITLSLHGTTFGGGPLACRVALAFLEETGRLLPSIRRNGAYLHAQLRDLQRSASRISEIRGIGLMAGIQLTVPGEPIVLRALEHRLVINCTHGNILRLLPPYIAGTAEIDKACATLHALLAD
jgi:acetylornithine/N-succinyldiaminopimelate aminotransferase